MQGAAAMVPVADLAPLKAQLGAEGISLEEIFADLGHAVDLGQEAGHGASSVVPLSVYYRALGILSKLTGDEIYHLSSRPFLRGSNDFITTSALESSNPFDAMQAIAKSTNLLYGGKVNIVEKRGKLVNFIIDDVNFPYKFDAAPFNYLTMECAILYIIGMLDYLSSSKALRYMRRFCCKRPEYDPERDFLSHLNVPLEFGASRYMIQFDAALISVPMISTCPPVNVSKVVAEHVIAQIEGRQNVSGREKSATQNVIQALENGRHTLGDVAGHLGVSTTTLKRHLKLEATSFRELMNDTFCRQAKSMIAQGVHPIEVSERLGYSEFRSFYRAFKNWTGQTPNNYRANAAAPSPTPPPSQA